MPETKKNKFASFEHFQSFWYIALMTFVGGYMDAYTFVMRGGVFSNNQTGNVAILGIHLFNGDMSGAINAFLPIIATVLGAFTAELVKNSCKNLKDGAWQRIVLLCEIPVFIAAGFIPLTVPNAVVNVSLSFIAAFQLSAFRMYEGWTFNSTIMTGNLRLLGQNTYKAIFVEKNKLFTKKTFVFLALIMIFVVGCLTSAMLSNFWSFRAILVCVPIPAFLAIANKFACKKNNGANGKAEQGTQEKES